MKYLLVIPCFVVVFILIKDQGNEKLVMQEIEKPIESILEKREIGDYIIHREIGNRTSIALGDSSSEKEKPLYFSYEKIARTELPSLETLRVFRKTLSSPKTVEFIREKLTNIGMSFDYDKEGDRLLAVDVFKKAISWSDNPLIDEYKNLAEDTISKDLNDVEDVRLRKSIMGDRIEMLLAMDTYFEESFEGYDMPDILRSEYKRVRETYL